MGPCLAGRQATSSPQQHCVGISRPPDTVGLSENPGILRAIPAPAAWLDLIEEQCSCPMRREQSSDGPGHEDSDPEEHWRTSEEAQGPPEQGMASWEGEKV